MKDSTELAGRMAIGFYCGVLLSIFLTVAWQVGETVLKALGNL